ncbi:type-2 ice-structuring protein-like [Penaeus monodon]|uniref:type-2 ice-structuring protein-like n=1 Tax=Penaeus monodon TaxID=6687 RepID=UPI0018A71AD8|nr:type-2 ice-structuring protein-like [Penaeus monodon]
MPGFLLRLSVAMGFTCALAAALAIPVPENDDLRSAVAVSKLVLAQQAVFFRELINATRERTSGCAPHVRSEMSVSCPSPFANVMGECFYLSKILLTWDQARTHCLGMGAELAVPRHLYGLKSFVVGENGPIVSWVGAQESEVEEPEATDVEAKSDESRWQWVDESVVEPELFYSKPPSRRPNHKICIELRKDRHPALEFKTCTTSQRFICQLH